MISMVFHQISAGKNVGEVLGLLQYVWKVRMDKRHPLLYNNLKKHQKVAEIETKSNYVIIYVYINMYSI